MRRSSSSLPAVPRTRWRTFSSTAAGSWTRAPSTCWSPWAARGALFIGPEGHRLFPAVKVTAVDTTAAGDTFNGALARKLADGCGYEQAIVFANHASALSVSRPGAQTSIPSYEEVTAFMREPGAPETDGSGRRPAVQKRRSPAIRGAALRF